MPVSMFKASAPIFVQFLTSLSAVLDKTAAHAEAKKIDPSVLLNTRLYPDMFPLVRQVRAATDHAISACGRLAGVDLPTFTNTESSIPELKDRIAKAIEFKSDDVLQVEQGSLYPALHRLIKRGWISAEEGTSENNRRAKFYRLTAKGRRQLGIETGKWEKLAGAIAQILRPAEQEGES